jgi:hypothetical protein
MATKTIPALPLRTPVVDSEGRISRPWLIALQALQGTGTDTGQGPPGETGPVGPTGPPGIAGVAPPAPNVTIGTATVTFRNDHKVEVDVNWTAGASANAQNFTGVAVYLEDPDISTGPIPKLDGSTTLDGTAQASGKWVPVFENDSLVSPAILFPDPDISARQARNIRVYLASYGPNATPKLVRANQASPTPSIVVAIPRAPQSGESGMEYAFLITDPHVDINTDFDRPDPQYSLTFTYTPPDPTVTPPPGMNRFGGVRIFYVYYQPDGHSIVLPGTDTGIDIPVNQSHGGVQSPIYSAGAGNTKFRVYFCSEDDSQPLGSHINTLVAAVNGTVSTTPYVEVEVTTEPLAPDVSSFTIANQQVVWQLSGIFVAQADFAWNIPSSARYSGVRLYLVNVVGSSYYPVALTSTMATVTELFTLDVLNVPASTETWTIAAISVDTNGMLSDDPASYGGAGFHSPTVQWIIGPPAQGTPGGGLEFAPPVTINAGATITPTEALSSDGVRMVTFDIGSSASPAWTNPTSNQFGHARVEIVVNGQFPPRFIYDVPANQSWFSTPAVPAFGTIGLANTIDAYIVSVDPQDNANSVAGTTPKVTGSYTPQSGAIIAKRFDNFDHSEFQWIDPSPGFSAFLITAQKIQVGSTLVVGGASGAAASFAGQNNGQIAVKRADGSIVAWMGQQQATQGDGSQIYGGWFGQLWVGGTDPRDAPLYVNNAGQVIVGGIAGTSKTYPYISVRDDSGVEQGRIGAKLAVGTSGPSTLTSGAWFSQLAVGGTNLLNWNVLIVPDPAKPNAVDFQIRNCHLFTIDYPANSNNQGLSNAHYTTEFGTSVWTGAGYANLWSFPGIRIYEPGRSSGSTYFGAAIISRGIVLRGPAAGNPLTATLDMFNGTQDGNDLPLSFWGELQLFSPNSPYNRTVFLAGGGAATGNSSFAMADVNGTNVFEVRSDATVWIKSDLYQYTGAQKLISGGVFVGTGVNVSSFAVTAGSYTVGAATVINTAGAFVGAGVDCRNNAIGGTGIAVWVTGLGAYAFGVDGSFVIGTRTFTITKGIITSIV